MMIDGNILFTGGFDCTIKLTVLFYDDSVFINFWNADLSDRTWRSHQPHINDWWDWAFGEPFFRGWDNILGLSAVKDSKGRDWLK
jgi:hypothetical protein